MSGKLLTIDHEELEALRQEIFRAFESGAGKPVFEKIDLFWARLAMHICAEHLHLFPALSGAISKRKLLDETGARISPKMARSAIESLKQDHDFFMRELAATVKLLRGTDVESESLIISVAREKITEISRRLAEHNELEESQVYKWADAVLNPAERAVLNEKMKKEIENLPPRFGSRSTELPK